MVHFIYHCLADRLVGRLCREAQVSGNPAQYDDLGIFVNEQQIMRQLVGESLLPTLELDVSDNDIAGAADRVADWMAETGGLWAK